MHPIFKTTPKHVTQLNDEQARELLARLCRAELAKHSISQANVAWGGDQRAKDGGVDVLVEVRPPVGLKGYIPRDIAAFQVKAEKLGPARVAQEMEPSGKLRPLFHDLAKAKGAYVIASTRENLSHTSQVARVSAMEEVLKRHSMTRDVVCDFYDGRKIADWVEQHPAVCLWTRDVIGSPLAGWKPYGPWAYQETDVAAQYIIDARAKVFTPNSEEGTDVTSAINQLRGDLKERRTVRLVGLSGVGKTRLAQALFDDRIVTYVAALDPGLAIYVDLSSAPSPTPEAMTEALLSSGNESVLIVDNCGQEAHARLAQLVSKPGSKIQLLTIEYDIRDDIPEGTACYRLEGSSTEVVEEMLKRRFQLLSQADVRTISSFSEGNARVAFALASTAEATGELSRLRDDELFRRLFVQRQGSSDDLLRTARAASLVYSLNSEDLGAESEIARLAALVGIGPVVFRQNLGELLRRGLVQQRGNWMAVLPHAIANRLAAQALEDIPKNVVVKALAEGPNWRLAKSFSRRLGFLHETRSAQQIANEWLSEGGKFADASALEGDSLAIFTNIAPVCPRACLESIARATSYPNFVSGSNASSETLIRLVRSLAYEATLFDRAADVLLKFALADPKERHKSQAVDALKSLFYSRLSGTDASPTQRQAFVRKLVLSTDPVESELGLELLNAALEAYSWTSHYDFAFGARHRGYGWHPRSRTDVNVWYGPFVELAAQVGSRKSPIGKRARQILGSSTRSLVSHAGMVQKILDLAPNLKKIDGWPEGWLGIRRALKWDYEILGPDTGVIAAKLDQFLTPTDLLSKIRARVLQPSPGLDDNDDEESDAVTSYERAQKLAEELGESLAYDETALHELLPELFSSRPLGNIYHLGVGVGRLHPEPLRFLDLCKTLLRDLPSASTIFVRGTIAGFAAQSLNETQGFLDRAVGDEVYGPRFPELQVQVTLDERAVERLIKAIAMRSAPPWQFTYLGLGRATEPLSISQVSRLLSALADWSSQGLLAALEVLAMVVYGSKEKDEAYRRELGLYCAQFFSGLDWNAISQDRDRTEHELEVVITHAVRFATFDDVASGLDRFIAHERSRSFAFDHRGKLLAPLFEKYPLKTLQAVYQSSASDENNTSVRLVLDADRNETALTHVPLQELIEWCEESPSDRFEFAAQAYQLLRETRSSLDPNVAETSFSPGLISLFGAAPDKARFVDLVLDRFFYQGGIGSRAKALEDKLPLLDQLNPAHDTEIAVLLESTRRSLLERIAWYRDIEETSERRRAETFE